MKRSQKLSLFALGLAGAASAIALAAIAAPAPAPSKVSLAGSRVDNFMLADQTGMGHELYYYKGKSAIVIVTAAQGDKVTDRAEAALAKLQEAYKDKNVFFAMLDSSLKSKRDEFEGRPGSASLPVLSDELQLVGRSMGVTQTGEAFVLDPKSWRVAYHGPIDATFGDLPATPQVPDFGRPSVMATSGGTAGMALANAMLPPSQAQPLVMAATPQA